MTATKKSRKINLRVHLPKWITKMFPLAIWTMPTGEKTVYLTFDDGPIPEVTPLVLDILKEYDIKATFFCVGENVWRNPDVFERIKNEGHSVGNHTYNHLQGIKCSHQHYIDNIEKANNLIGSNMFRPPHGLLKQSQYYSILNKYKIIMWDVISCDYDPTLSPQTCYKNVVNYVRDGSIITFHDSLKAEKNILEALPRVIKHLKNEGYIFKKIEFPGLRPLKTHKVQDRLQTLRHNINRLFKRA